MQTAPNGAYGIAIVGGGVAGCYCAYRLSAALPRERIVLFEAAPRLGGRLESMFMPGLEIAAELGGAFITDLHATTLTLLRELDLSLVPIDWSRQFSFMRGRRIIDQAYRNDPAGVPYDFSAQERGRTPAEILRSALRTIAPRMADLWPMNRAGAPDEATAYLQQLRFDGRPLHDWDIGVLLRDVVSGEAYTSFLTAFGASANFRNANAYDAIATLMSEWAPQRGFVVEGGFQRLPLEMARRSSADVHTSAPVIGIGPGPHGGVRLSLKHDGVQRTVFANRIILALPPDALRRIRLETRPADVRALNAQLSTVRPVSACKLFLSFARPWWPTRHSPSALSIDASYTDQPMQQCYYYGASEGAPALLLAVFADDQTTSFWRPLFEADTGAAADRMIAESLRQLRAMHPDAGIPDPIGARARLWAAAWHVWKPGARSWETARVLRGPHLGLRAFVCGEAFSTQQGWVEGALNSAAALLHEHFGLDLLL